jgi:hypothetical protein
MLYSTGEVIKLFEVYKELMFMAFTGAYEGKVIKYNPIFRTIVWHDNNIDEAVMIDEDFLKTKWKMVSASYAKLVKHPYVKLFEECMATN